MNFFFLKSLLVKDLNYINGVNRNFQQPLSAPAVNSSVSTEYKILLMINEIVNGTAVNGLLQFQRLKKFC